MNGRAAFAPDAVAFIRSLPNNGKLSIKTTRSTDGRIRREISIPVQYLMLETKSRRRAIGLLSRGALDKPLPPIFSNPLIWQ
jgi:hypothetical protein